MAEPDSTQSHSDAAPAPPEPAPAEVPPSDQSDVRIDRREEDRLDQLENARRPRSETRRMERSFFTLYLILTALLLIGALLLWRHFLHPHR